jgi:predicted XRE-type DNA-binding protein
MGGRDAIFQASDQEDYRMRVTRSSGNIFADIGLKNASEHAIKARLVLALTRIIDASGLSQTAAARRIGIAQPDLSRILRGNFSGFFRGEQGPN